MSLTRRPASAIAARMADAASSRTLPMGWRDMALKPKPVMAAFAWGFSVVDFAMAGIR